MLTISFKDGPAAGVAAEVRGSDPPFRGPGGQWS